MKARRKNKKINQNTDFMRIFQKLTSYKKAERRAGKESCEGLNTRGKVRNSRPAKTTPNEGR